LSKMHINNHLVPADHSQLEKIDDHWPYQFLSEYTRYQKHVSRSDYYIIHDEITDAFIPLKIYKVRGFHFGQIKHAPLRNGIEINESEQLDFFNRLISFLKENKFCTKLVQPPPSGILSAVPAGATSCEFGSYIIDLENQTEEQIFNKFHPKYQKAISHSFRNNARIEVGRHTLEDFHDLYLQTMSRAGLHPVPLYQFARLYDYLGENRVFSAVVHDSEKPIGAVFIMSSKYAAFVAHAGSNGKNKLYGAMKFLNYEMMKLMKSNGVKRYDFVGVRINNKNPELEGIFKFKKRFGGDLKRGYLWKIDINTGSAATFDILKKVRIGNAPMPDIIDQVTLESKQFNNG